jgi:hypothetical protein
VEIRELAGPKNEVLAGIDIGSGYQKFVWEL